MSELKGDRKGEGTNKRRRSRGLGVTNVGRGEALRHMPVRHVLRSIVVEVSILHI